MVPLGHQEQPVLLRARGPEQLHDLTAAVDGELTDASETLGGHYHDLYLRVSRNDQVQVCWTCEVTLEA